MKQLWIKLALAVCGIVALFALLGIVGGYDYTSQIVYNMSLEDYEATRDLLTEQNGHEPSDREIARYWVEHNQ